jgi:hypothetical protein
MRTRVREGSATYEMQLTAYPRTFVPSKSNGVPNISFDCVCTEHGPVPVQIRQGRARSRCRCGRSGPSPGADPAGAGPVSTQMWQKWAQIRCRCGRGGPSPGADVAGVGPVPVQMSERRAVVQSLWVDLTDAFVRSDTREDCRAKAPDLVGHVQVQQQRVELCHIHCVVFPLRLVPAHVRVPSSDSRAQARTQGRARR